MNMTLVGDEEPCADLNALGSKHECGRYTSAIEYPSGCKNRNVEGINHLRHKGHCVDVSDVSSGLGTFRHDSGGSEFLHLEGVSHRRHDRNHLDSGRLPFFHVGGRGTGPGRHNLDSFLDYHVSHLSGIRSLKHDVDSERLVGEGLAFADLLSDGFGAEIDG